MKTNILYLAAVLAVPIVVAGCGSASVAIDPNFHHEELRGKNLAREYVRIMKVTDGRSPAGPKIGDVHTGMMNKRTPYLLNGSLADIVKTMLDTLLALPGNRERIFPVMVSIDMFEVGENIGLFSEEGYFACNLRFSYPVTGDSLTHRSFFSQQTTSGMDVTNALEPLIYRGVADCAHQFVEEVVDRLDAPTLLLPDSVSVLAVHDSLRAMAVREDEQRRVSEVPTGTGPRKSRQEGAGFQYCQGAKIATGVRGSYLMLSQKEASPWLLGLGISITYLDIVNKQDMISGSFINFGGRLVARHLFSDAPTSAYIGGNLGLAGGTEQIKGGVSDEKNFFFGPTVEEVVGVSFGGALSLEFGAFQLAHFGSKALPSDIGFIVGISVGL